LSIAYIQTIYIAVGMCNWAGCQVGP